MGAAIPFLASSATLPFKSGYGASVTGGSAGNLVSSGVTVISGLITGVVGDSFANAPKIPFLVSFKSLTSLSFSGSSTSSPFAKATAPPAAIPLIPLRKALRRASSASTSSPVAGSVLWSLSFCSNCPSDNLRSILGSLAGGTPVAIPPPAISLTAPPLAPNADLAVLYNSKPAPMLPIA